MYVSVTLILALLLGRTMSAQLPGIPAPAASAAPAKPAEQDPLGRDNPRGCVLGFLKAVEHENYSEAAEYLDIRAAPSQRQELARQLQVVLNHGLSGNLDDLSRAVAGNLKDGLRENRDRAGNVVTSFGRLDILLDRVQRATGPPIWLFSSETLQSVPRAFDEINAPDVERFFPRPLREVKLLSLPLWRWFLIFVAVGLAIVLASLATRALMPLLRPTLRRMTGQTDDRYLLSLRHPLRLLLLALAIRLLASGAISVLARALWTNISHILAIVGVSWLLIQFSNAVSDLRARQLVRRQTTSQIAVLTLVHRLFKILVLFLAVVWLLQGAGVNVSAMLAGLGIGGIALALAAQKTLEDLFGGITVITRKAVRVGDFCQLADQMGTIEEIGLGSTRVRTLNNTVVTIPNAKVSQMSLENYSMRKKIWFHQIFGLRSDTSPEQMRQVLSQVTEMLRGDQRVEQESARIRFIGFGASSLQLEIFAYIKTTDYAAFLENQEDLMLHIMDIIAANGTSIALPSQITYLDRDKWGRADKLRPAAEVEHRGNQAGPREGRAQPETGMAHSTGEP
jgi:MscS family membrane protein